MSRPVVIAEVKAAYGYPGLNSARAEVSELKIHIMFVDFVHDAETDGINGSKGIIHMRKPSSLDVAGTHLSTQTVPEVVNLPVADLAARAC